MAIFQAMCTSFKVDILSGTQNFAAGGNTFKIALYTAAANLDATTTAYTTSGEVVGAGYTAGGNTLVVSQVPTSTGTTSFLSFTDAVWANAYFTARGALIYNSTNSNKAVAVLDFGSDKTSGGANFTVQFPAATSSTAIIRIA
jgi:hypothetical protein